MQFKLCRNHTAFKLVFEYKGEMIRSYESHFTATAKVIEGQTQRIFLHMN